MIEDLNLDALHLGTFSTPQISHVPFEDSGGTSTPDLETSLNLEPTDLDEMEITIADLKAKDQKREMDKHFGDKSSLKFLEASGVIEFCRVFNVQQIRKDTRKRHCKLQLAYSVKDDNSNVKYPRKTSIEGEDCYSEERNEFLQCLQLQMTKQEGNINLMTPKYVRGQLKFDRIGRERIQGIGDKDFVFNYKIHVIIYENNTKCRLNLSHEFEGKEYAEDADG